MGKSKNENTPKKTSNSIWEVQTIHPKAFPAVSEIL
jgi:hypothetical protein